jgi:hypothetical protein
MDWAVTSAYHFNIQRQQKPDRVALKLHCWIIGSYLFLGECHEIFQIGC